MPPVTGDEIECSLKGLRHANKGPRGLIESEVQVNKTVPRRPTPSDMSADCWLQRQCWNVVIIPSNPRRWAIVVLMLGKRRRRWPSIQPTMDRRIVLAGLVQAAFVCITPPPPSHVHGDRAGLFCSVRIDIIKKEYSKLGNIADKTRELSVILMLTCRRRGVFAGPLNKLARVLPAIRLWCEQIMFLIGT